MGSPQPNAILLLEIWKSESISMSELSEKMNLNSSTMTRILDNLVRDGYILREKSEEDRRLVLVSLSEKGKDSAVELNETVNAYYKKIIYEYTQWTARGSVNISERSGRRFYQGKSELLLILGLIRFVRRIMYRNKGTNHTRRFVPFGSF